MFLAGELDFNYNVGRLFWSLAQGNTGKNREGGRQHERESMEGVQFSSAKIHILYLKLPFECVCCLFHFPD